MSKVIFNKETLSKKINELISTQGVKSFEEYYEETQISGEEYRICYYFTNTDLKNPTLRFFEDNTGWYIFDLMENDNVQGGVFIKPLNEDATFIIDCGEKIMISEGFEITEEVLEPLDYRVEALGDSNYTDTDSSYLL